MFPQVVQTSWGDAYMNVAVGLIDTNKSNWIRVQGEEFGVRPSIITTESNSQNFNSLMAAPQVDHIVVWVVGASSFSVYERGLATSWVKWQDTQCYQNYYTAFVAISAGNDTGCSIGDVLRFSASGTTLVLKRDTSTDSVFNNDPVVMHGSRDAITPVDGTPIVRGGLGVQMTLQANRAHLWATEEAVSTDTGALIVDGGVGIAGDMHVNCIYADSDRRLKRDISAIDDDEALRLVEGIGAYRYTYKHDEAHRTRIGVIAQDIQQIVPEAVKGIDSTEFLSVDIQQLVPLLVGSIRALKKQMVSK
jgi:hypothetical protein